MHRRRPAHPPRPDPRTHDRQNPQPSDETQTSDLDLRRPHHKRIRVDRQSLFTEPDSTPPTTTAAAQDVLPPGHPVCRHRRSSRSVIDRPPCSGVIIQKGYVRRFHQEHWAGIAGRPKNTFLLGMMSTSESAVVGPVRRRAVLLRPATVGSARLPWVVPPAIASIAGTSS